MCSRSRWGETQPLRSVGQPRHIAAIDPEAVLAILPADQLILDEDGYRETAARALQAASEGRIVTLGIPATRPETGYGYIRAGEEVTTGVRAVEAFKEKPDVETALTYLADGRYYWNAGMFFVRRRSLMMDEMALHAPDVAAGAGAARQRAFEAGLRGAALDQHRLCGHGANRQGDRDPGRLWMV